MQIQLLLKSSKVPSLMVETHQETSFKPLCIRYINSAQNTRITITATKKHLGAQIIRKQMCIGILEREEKQNAMQKSTFPSCALTDEAETRGERYSKGNIDISV